MRKQEAAGVIDTLDDLFVFLGASDVRFKIDHFSYPLTEIHLNRKNAFGMDSTPVISGLFGPWEVSGVWIDKNGLFNSIAAWDVHWAKVRHAFDYHLKFMGHLPTRHINLGRFDSFSRFQFIRIGRSGEQLTDETRLFAYKGPAWHVLSERSDVVRVPRPGEGWLTQGNEICISLCVSEPSYWLAKIRMEEMLPGLALITDATGIKDLLRFRNVPEGKKRRDALLHWVAEHWRQSRVDPDVEHYVRKHLRGARACTHGNYSIEVQASREDKLENLLAERQREVMRRLNPRPDRRRRRA